jgi:hypothetical protein
LFISSDSGSNLVSNYNDWNMNGKATLQWGGTYLLSQWQQSFSQDLASIDADPLFANPNQGDFHLTSGSPALAKGATIGFTTDAAGVPLPAGGPIDMGAYQSSGVSGQSAVQLIARNSGKCLDVPGSSSGPIQVDQWQCLAGINQKWNLIALGDGSYELASASSGMALDVAGGSMADGVPVMQWPYWGASHQRWYLQQSADGYVQLTAQHSGKCLEVSGGPDATGNGVGLQQWSCWGGANQQWQLVPAR